MRSYASKMRHARPRFREQAAAKAIAIEEAVARAAEAEEALRNTEEAMRNSGKAWDLNKFSPARSSLRSLTTCNSLVARLPQAQAQRSS